MSQLAGISSIAKLIDTTKIALWFNVNDINLSIGSNITSIYSSYGYAGAYTKNNSDLFTLAFDSEGYKCLRSTHVSGGTFFQTGANSINLNNNETFIAIMNVSDAAMSTVGAIAGASPGQLTHNQFNYGNYTTGSGRVTYTSSLKKIILTGVVNAASMYVLEGYKSLSFLASPAAGSGTNVSRIFNTATTNPNASSVDFYFAARIQETYDNNTLQKIIRALAFEHGVKI